MAEAVELDVRDRDDVGVVDDELVDVLVVDVVLVGVAVALDVRDKDEVGVVEDELVTVTDTVEVFESELLAVVVDEGLEDLVAYPDTVHVRDTDGDLVPDTVPVALVDAVGDDVAVTAISFEIDADVSTHISSSKPSFAVK